MILGSQPLFASEHDDKVGSIYFEKGRLRLIHPSGPTREVYRSYCLCMTNPDKKARNRDIDTIRIWVKKYWDAKIYPSIEAFEKKFLGSIRMIKVDKHASLLSGVRRLLLKAARSIMDLVTAGTIWILPCRFQPMRIFVNGSRKRW